MRDFIGDQMPRDCKYGNAFPVGNSQVTARHMIYVCKMVLGETWWRPVKQAPCNPETAGNCTRAKGGNRGKKLERHECKGRKPARIQRAVSSALQEKGKEARNQDSHAIQIKYDPKIPLDLGPLAGKL